MTASPLRVALCGNPNAGKTTLFNALTGQRRHVGNYPGVTVDLAEGRACAAGRDLRVVDLPGIYSLTAASPEELLARGHLLQGAPDVIVQAVDAACLERSLYLTVQLLELGRPVVLALTMLDVARRQGLDVDHTLLATLLGVDIVPVAAIEGRGLDRLLQTAVAAADRPGAGETRVRYGRELDEAVARLADLARGGPLPPRWTAVKLLEGDAATEAAAAGLPAGRALLEASRGARDRLSRLYGETAELLLADRRYGFISGACQEAVRTTVEARHAWSDRVDDVVASRVLGLPIFLAVMYAMFHLTFTLGEVPGAWVAALVEAVGRSVSGLWAPGSPSALRSLLVDGVVGGVGSVLVYLPNVLVLFGCMALLEDTGYMARAAFLTDWMMHRVGLHGRSFIPMLLGFGCTVPGILATRTLESPRDRLTTMLVLPLMSCSARFPVYSLVIPAFFEPAWRATVMWSVYLFGVLLAVGLAKLLRSTLLAGESIPFVMELPVYRLPTLRGVAAQVWLQASAYLRKAGTVILAGAVVLWALHHYPGAEGASLREAQALARADAAFELAVEELGEAAEADGERLALVALVRREHGRRDGSPPGVPGAALAAEVLGVRDELLAARREAGATPARREAALLSHVVLDLKHHHPRAAPLALRWLDEVEAPWRRAAEAARVARASEELEASLAGRLGSFLEPVLRPAGLDGRMATALLGSLAGKELFVAQLAIVAAVADGSEDPATLRTWLRTRYRPVNGLCILMFCLVGTPCLATLAATLKESGGWRWAGLQFAALTGLAWVLCLLVFQGATLLGL